MRLLFALLTAIVGMTPAAAQWLDYRWPNIPRTADGAPDLTAPVPRGADGHPDLSGIWNGIPPLVRFDAATLQPWVAELVEQRQEQYYRTRPAYLCQPSGPESQRWGGWRRVLQTPTEIAILHDDLTYRVIHMDGRELEDQPLPSWSGYSVGHWDGDALIVESVGFNDKTWASRFGVSHTEALRVTERWERTDFGHMQVDVTFTDPGAFTKPWEFSVDMELRADTEMLETVCERSSDEWTGSLSDANQPVTVPPEVLERYVGVYTGIYGGRERTYEVTRSGSDLYATIVGIYSGQGLGAPGLDEGAPRPLVPRSETAFEGLGLGYWFDVDENGEATALIVVHVSGEYRYARQR